MLTVTAYPVVEDVPGLIAYLGEVFGAAEKVRSVGSAGGYHAEVQIGDTLLMIGGGGSGVGWKGEARPMAFHIYVPDVDSTYKLAVERGGESMQSPTLQDWGERTADVKDPAGNRWYIATFQGRNYFSDGSPTVQPYLHPVRSGPVIAFLSSTFGATELGRADTNKGVVLHSTVKIGQSSLEFSDADDKNPPLPGMFYVYVANADKVYSRALKSGAVAVSAPADQPYGDRTGTVKDVAGNTWCIATPLRN